MSERKEFRELIPPERARRLIEDLPIDSGTEEVSLSAARGRITARRVEAHIDVPGFDRASMDGYAVRGRDTFGASEETPEELHVVESVHAGERPACSIEGGEAAEISTGAVLPPGADAVVMVERTTRDGDRLSITSAVAPGDHVMAAGADIGAGTRAIGPGKPLSARDIALLAAIGRSTVTVRAAPTVGIISTGNELVDPGAPIDHQRGEIYDVNGYSLAGAVAGVGGEPIRYPPVADDVDDLRQALDVASEECDLVLSSGSTSASAVDVIYDVIATRGELLAHGVAVKPGKPMIIGTLGDGSAYVGLPGYPVSALMVFRTFVAPRLRDAAGRPTDRSMAKAAEMAREARFDEGRMRLLPVGLLRRGDTLYAYPVDKGSGATTSLTDADGVVTVDADTAFVGAGERVVVDLFDDTDRAPSLLGVGESDPALDRLLDRVGDTRYLPVDQTEADRRFNSGVPDILVSAGDGSGRKDPILARWQRRWGLVSADDSLQLRGVEDLVNTSYRFANATGNGLRAAVDERLERLAAEQEVSQQELSSRIPGYERGRPGIESPTRRVLAGEVDVGVGLEVSASRYDVSFTPLGSQVITVYGRESELFEETLRVELPSILAELPGYEPV